MTTRPGTSLAELVLAAWLFAFVIAAVARFAGTQSRLSASQHDRTRAAEAVRTASVITEGDFRYLSAGDMDAAATESVRVRAFRGGGTVCRSDGAGLLVRYRGLRLPSPTKDSVLIVTADDVEDPPPLAVTGVAGDAACGGALRLTLSAEPASEHGIALVYESGSYHLSGGALRYRLGAGGRQPLTETLFTGTGFGAAGTGELSLRLELDPDSLPRLGALRYDLRLRQLNAPPP